MKREDFMLASSGVENGTSGFTRRVMNSLEKKTLRRSWWLIFPRMPRTSFAAVLLIAMLLFTGVAYAVTQLIKVTPTGINATGHESYTVEGSKGCSGIKDVDIQNYEVVKGAPNLGTEEIRKIIQAKCELSSLGEFTSQHFNSSATSNHSKWRDGDTIYYDDMSLLGAVTMYSPAKIVLTTSDGQVYTRNSFENKQIEVYDIAGEGHSTIKAGDTVFTVSHFSQLWEDPAKSTHSTEGTVQDLGVIAVIKLSLPLEYYNVKQGYITEISHCQGNEQESCPNTPSVDVYPRTGGEGAQNPYLITENRQMKVIAGQVTLLSDASVTLKTFTTGREFTITLSEPGFKLYNESFANAYTEMDAHVKVGDNLTVVYYEASGSHETSIKGDQVMTVELLLEGVSPKQSVNKY